MKPTKIKLEPNLIPLLKSMGMNWSAIAQKPFDFQPTSFTAKIDGLKPKVFNRQTQLDMMDDYLESPLQPGSFCVNSAPTDGRSKLLAAWMMQHHYRSGGTIMKWHDLTGGFQSPLLEERANVSLLVFNNVGPDSSQTKKEKLRDLLEMYADTAKIVIVNGCDPYTFFTLHLHLPLKGLCYMTNSSVKGIDL